LQASKYHKKEKRRSKKKQKTTEYKQPGGTMTNRWLPAAASQRLAIASHRQHEMPLAR